MREFFQLDDVMYHKNCIEWVRVDGGLLGFGCWGEIKLKHETKSRIIGDGSYAGDIRHIKHNVAGWNFWRIKEIMRDLLGENDTMKQHNFLRTKNEPENLQNRKL